MSKIAFLPIIVGLLAAAVISPSVIANTLAKSSDGDSGSGDGEKPKTTGHKKDDGGGGGGDNEPRVPHTPPPGEPVVGSGDGGEAGNGGGRIPILGSPVTPAGNGGGDNNGGGYDNGNIKNFDTSKSSFRIGGSDGKIVQYKPGFNETFYNSTLPYCFAVQSGSCYNSATGQITP